MHLGNHVLEEKERSVTDCRQPCAEAPGEAEGFVLPLDNSLLVLPLNAEGRIGQEVVKLLPLKPVTGLAVAERVSKHDVIGILVFDQHV